MSPVQFLASKFPGKSEQEYRSHLGNFQISGMTGYVSSVTEFARMINQVWLAFNKFQPLVEDKSLVLPSQCFHFKSPMYCSWMR